MRIDINAANTSDLQLLPGIGPTLADRILLERQLNGRFEAVEDLDRVPGIGPKIVESISEYVIQIDE